MAAWDAILQANWLKASAISGVEAVLGTGDQVHYRFVVVKRNKQSLDITRKGEEYASFEALAEALPKGPPVVLTLNGKGIIHRQLPEHETPDAQVVHQTLPNARIQDFYLQRYRGGTHLHSAIVRRSVLDAVLQQFESKGYRVVDVVLGPFSLVGIRPLIAPDATELVLERHQLRLNGGALEEYRQLKTAEDSSYILGDERLRATHLLPFAAGFEGFYPHPQRQPLEAPALGNARKEQQQKRLFEVAGWSVLLILFGALLVNFLLYDHYRQQKDTLQASLSLNQEQFERLTLLQQEFSDKQALVESTGVLSAPRLSYYADQLALSTPKRITLTELELHPLAKKIKQKEQINFTQQAIRLEGIALRSIDLNGWIQDLTDMEWVADVRLVNYSRDPKQNTGEFELNIVVQ
ncbi:MAG: hypothetical protein AAGB22_04640 [Bacteroidota bacterium]